MGPLWASAQGAIEGTFELVVAGPQGVVARFASDVRGHGLATHPAVPTRVVMFGRRPQRTGLVADLERGVLGTFSSPAGRHHVGHGCFDADASRLLVAEADDVTGQGTIAVLDAQSLERIDEFDTHGIGPHEVVLLPDGETLAIANGGLVTAPGGRDPINLETMQSSLTHVDVATGTLRGTFTVPESKASIRHLAVGSDGAIVAVMQIQRDALDDVDPRPLIAVQQPGEALVPLDDGLELGTAMVDYAGGVALDELTRTAAVTSPRGNLVAYWNVDSGRLVGTDRFDDVSGVTVSSGLARFVLTGSSGQVRHTDVETLDEQPEERQQLDALWDNHLRALPFEGA